MVNLARVIAQVAIVGTQIVGRAFVEAYKQAAAESAKNAAGAGAAKLGKDVISQKTGMSFDEASQILNVSKDASLEEIVKKYETMLTNNDPEKGGSFYLQSKIVRARERLELELERRQQELSEKSNGQ